jgi:diguanylate cyclase (GGDEF)-like protein
VDADLTFQTKSISLVLRRYILKATNVALQYGLLLLQPYYGAILVIQKGGMVIPRKKIILLATAPVLVAFCAIAFVVRYQAIQLGQQQRASVETAYVASKETELKHYVALGLKSIAPLYETGNNDLATQNKAKAILAKMDYGDDGYFFIYDLQGTNLMHPRLPEVVGKNLWELRDAQGNPTIQKLIAKARAGGGLERYWWEKPSLHKDVPKLGYVVMLDRWGWMLGTGIYLDDVDAALAKIDEQNSRNIQNTMISIAVIAAAIIIIIATIGFVLNMALQLANRQLEMLSITDSLTGLANRRHFNETLNAEWLRASRSKQPLGAIMIDIDQFKQYNDHYGHIPGDVCLRRVGEVLGKSFRSGVDFVARYGGEEFAVIMPGADMESAYLAADRAREAVASLKAPHKKAVHGIVTISVGVAALVPSEFSTAESLFKLADEALYTAKQSGRNRVQRGIRPNISTMEKNAVDSIQVSQTAEEKLQSI